MMRAEAERWAEALAIERLHGDAAAAFIAKRIAQLALDGDFEGITRLREIANRLEQLANPRRFPPI